SGDRCSIAALVTVEWILGFPKLRQRSDGSAVSGLSQPGIDTQGTKADCVGRDAGVTDTGDCTLHGQRPLPFGMKVPVNAGRHTGLLEPGDATTGAAMLIEGGIMPEDVERLVTAAEPVSGLERLVECSQLTLLGRPARGSEGLGIVARR